MVRFSQVTTRGVDARMLHPLQLIRFGDASDPGEVRRPVGLQLSYVDDVTGVWGVDDQPAAEVDADVAGGVHGALGAGYEQSGDGGTHHRVIPYPYFGSYQMSPYRP